MVSMERAATKSWIERQLAYDEVKRLLVRLVQFPSPQTGRFEAEPQVRRLIREVVLPELQAAGIRGEIDQMGNLVAHLKGAGARESLMLVGYAMNAAPSIGDTEPFEVKVEARDFMYPSEVSTQAGVVRALGEAIRVMLGKEPAYSYSTAANDTGFLNIKGIEAVNYGSRDIRFQHTDHDLACRSRMSTRRPKSLPSWRFAAELRGSANAVCLQGSRGQICADPVRG